MIRIHGIKKPMHRLVTQLKSTEGREAIRSMDKLEGSVHRQFAPILSGLYIQAPPPLAVPDDDPLTDC